MNELVESPFSQRQVEASPDSSGSRQNQSREMAETQTKYLMAEHSYFKDLVQAPEETVEFVNYYQFSTTWETRAEADVAPSSALRLALLKFTKIDGKIARVELV